jgi:hypothetical protein
LLHFLIFLFIKFFFNLWFLLIIIWNLNWILLILALLIYQLVECI